MEAFPHQFPVFQRYATQMRPCMWLVCKLPKARNLHRHDGNKHRMSRAYRCIVPLIPVGMPSHQQISIAPLLFPSPPLPTPRTHAHTYPHPHIHANTRKHVQASTERRCMAVGLCLLNSMRPYASNKEMAKTGPQSTDHPCSPKCHHHGLSKVGLHRSPPRKGLCNGRSSKPSAIHP